jgi:sugar/nucleoside kinase (ribokinase family)
MAAQYSDVIVAGHFAIDRISLSSRSSPFIVLGGSATYVSLTAKRLGAKVSIISHVGKDFPEAYLWWLREEGVNLSNVTKLDTEQTTSFELIYNANLQNRSMRLRNRASPLKLSDIPGSRIARFVHIAPIAGEISYRVVNKLKKCAEFSSLDPQGLLRRFDKSGKVTARPLDNKALLNFINIYKSSSDEIMALAGTSKINSAIDIIHDFGVKIVIVTLGAKGAVLSVEKTLYDIPVYIPRICVDPTGAGDAFMGGFLAEYVRDKDALWCACVGSAAASLVVEGIGPTFFGEKEEIYQRARYLYEKEIKT